MEQQMKHPIKHRYTGAVLFEADILDNTPSGMVVRAALEQATKVHAELWTPKTEAA
jgi:hypothetical protein